MPETASTRPRPLAGVRVLDFTIMMAGPYATRYLADLGAEVIKVESADGDYIRSRAPLRSGHSAYFSHLNAGKQSIVLDLKNPAALQAIKELVGRCDVVVENFRPGVMKRLGLDYDSLSALNPRLVMCSISGFGQTGPDALLPAYAQIVQAGSGYELAFANYQTDGSEGGGRPANAGIFIADVLGGTYAFAGVLAALNQRHVTGRGQHVDATLIESMLNLMPYEVQEAQFPEPRRRPVYPPFPTRDGGYLMIAAVSPKNFEALLDAIGFDGWRSDPTLHNDTARQANWAAVMARISAWTAQRDMAENERVIGGAGVPITGYRTVRQALDQTQLVHRGSLAKASDGGGEHLIPNLPFKLSDGDVQVGCHTPALGENTDDVLARVLGWDQQRIAQAKAPATKAAPVNKD